MNIIELAKKACAPNQTFNSDEEWVERFATLVRAEREWVDLTDDEIYSLAEDIDWAAGAYFSYAEAVIAAFKEKNK